MRRQDPPDLRVIDAAIARMRNRQNSFTCIALGEAAISMRQSHLSLVYSDQYSQYMLDKDGNHPYWWNSVRPHIAKRIAALEAFKAACIKAGKDLAKKKAAKA